MHFFQLEKKNDRGVIQRIFLSQRSFLSLRESDLLVVVGNCLVSHSSLAITMSSSSGST